MSYSSWPEYVPVAKRRRRAEKEVAKLKKQGRAVAPVTIAGRKIATSFWGLSWCTNLERYSDYATRLPRGRSYVRNGHVVDLQIGTGQVTATVSGSRLYEVKVSIKPVARAGWTAICRDCAGSIDSLVELLQGRLAKGVMDRVCREGDGLFPAPGEIKLSCTCPDWADMCKHVAAVLYGVGARLDEKPQLLFALRGVDEKDMIAGADQNLARSQPAPKAANVLGDGDVAALFGLDMAETIDTGGSAPVPAGPSPRTKPSKQRKVGTPTKVSLIKTDDSPKRARSGAGSMRKVKTATGKERAKGPINIGTSKGR
jgi:uncharacterized Zn finger protein